MTKTFDITLQKVDNGFQIRTRPDDRSGQTLVATNEGEVKKLLNDVVDHIFDPIPAKVKPTPPQA